MKNHEYRLKLRHLHPCIEAQTAYVHGGVLERDLAVEAVLPHDAQLHTARLGVHVVVRHVELKLAGL